MFVYKQVILPNNLEIKSSLQSIYGIGKHKAFCISTRMGLSNTFHIKNLNNYFTMLLYFVLDFYTWLEARVRRIYKHNIKILVDINVYKGIRHKDNLPVRGQRTRTNANTKKKTTI